MKERVGECVCKSVRVCLFVCLRERESVWNDSGKPELPICVSLFQSLVVFFSLPYFWKYKEDLLIKFFSTSNLIFYLNLVNYIIIIVIINIWERRTDFCRHYLGKYFDFLNL